MLVTLASGGPAALLGPLWPHEWSEFIVGVVLMLILWIVVAKKVVPAFEKMYAERSDQIAGGIERAEKAQAEAEASKEEYKQLLADARQEAAKIREDAKNEGARIKSDMREQAEADAARIVAQAHAAVEAERSQVVNQLRNEVGGMALTLSGRIVGESLDNDDRARRTVDRFLSELESQGSVQS